MKVQGGEQKVMKKILTVALSTAMAFSMFASVAFGDSAVTPQQKFDALAAKGVFNGYPDKQAHLERDMTRAEFAKVLTKLLGLKELPDATPSYKDKGYDKKNWAFPYIEAVTAAGIMEGQDTTKGIFNYNGKVTVQEMAAVLTRALKLEVPEKVDNSASDWAKGYVQAAINKGLLSKDTNFQANATREQLVEAAYAIDQLKNLTVASYKVAENGKDIEFTLNTGEVVKVTLEKALEPNKETEVKFKNAAGQEITAKVTWVVEAATKVSSAAATNLKEVEVSFDGKVDKVTATDKNNYTIDNNSKGIKSITLLPDNKTARILLNESSKFTQGTTYKVVVKNVKSSTGTVLPQGEVAFTVSDNTLPQVTEVKALGTKVIKVTFSEPIVKPSSSNFQLDDKTFTGSVEISNNLREVILRDYTGGFAVGPHKLTSSLIEDYAGLKALSQTNEFTAAVDTEGPKVTEITATLEKVTVTFDKEIDPQSVKDDVSFYWMSGSTKVFGKATQVSSNVYEVAFEGDKRLPGYETTLHIDVKDYSGNAVQTKEVKVNATVDLVQPRVVEAAYGVNRSKTLTVRFDKSVDAADKKYFTIKDGDKLIPVKDVVAADASKKIYYVSFYEELKGTYSLKIADVKDTTALKNTMVEYNGTFVASDLSNPNIQQVDYNNNSLKVALHFGREMDLAALQSKGNYYIEFLKNGSDRTQTISIPTEVSVDPVNGAKSVVLKFPEYIDGTKVVFGSTVKSITATGLKSKDGQAVSMSSKPFESTQNKVTWDSAKQKDARTFELTFNQVLANVNQSDFLIDGTYPTNVTVNDNVVTLKTDKDKVGATITLYANNSIESYAGNRTDLTTNQSKTTYNAVAPKVVEVSPARSKNAAGNEYFDITFSNAVSTTDASQLKNVFLIKDLSKKGTPDVSPVNYNANIVAYNKVQIELLSGAGVTDKDVSVEVKENAYYLVASGTDVQAAKSDPYTVKPSSGEVATDVEVTGASNEVVPAVAASVKVAGLKFEAQTAGVEGNDIKFTLVKDEKAQDKVKIDGTTITVNGQAEAQDVADEITKSALKVNAKVDSVADFEKLTRADVALTGGAAQYNRVNVTLNKKVGSITKVTIDGNDFSNSVKFNGEDKFTVNTGAKDLTGKELLAFGLSTDGKVITIKGKNIGN